MIADKIAKASKDYHQEVKGKLRTKYLLQEDRESIAWEIAVKYKIKPEFFITLVAKKK